MKTATLPSLRVEPELRDAAESVLQAGETLSSFVETAVREGRMDYEGAGRLLRFYEDGLHGYTYLEG